MEKKQIIREMINVIGGSENLDPVYDGDWIVDLEMQISAWVNKYDVNNIEFILPSTDVEEVLGSTDEIKNLTSAKVTFVEGYSDMIDKKDSIFDEKTWTGDGQLPNWDPLSREETGWTDTYFYTGADSMYHVIVKKI